MKASKYNIYYTEEDNYYVCNLLTGSLKQIDKELFEVLKENKSEAVDAIPKDLMYNLQKSDFVCENDFVEENYILCTNKIVRFGNRHARITIMPTMNCNFKCWYCYETHQISKMKEEDVKIVLLFIENVIVNHKLISFQLDWFGGEPLLYFDEIIYRIGSFVKQLCIQHNIRFYHTMTTNGYLINESIVKKMDEICLRNFQITLDGNSFFHNKTRFTETDKNTYDAIVRNIVTICNGMKNPMMNVRINYTPKNISTVDEIAYSFPKDVRRHISITLQIVWQFKNIINEITEVLKEKLQFFNEMGYTITDMITPTLNCGCYAENMLQFVINHDLKVYKCTARDFSNNKYSIGEIAANGDFIPNGNFYNYFVTSQMENEKCLSCNLLPVCAGMCIQKKIEHSLPKCPYENLYKSVLSQIQMLIHQRDIF